MMIEYKNMSPEVISLLCSFSRIIVVDVPWADGLSSFRFLDSLIGSGVGFHLMEQTLRHFRICLITSIPSVPLIISVGVSYRQLVIVV